MSLMPKFAPKVPLAQALLVFLAMLFVAPTLPRFGPQRFAKRVGSSTKFLTRCCIGSASLLFELTSPAA